MYKIDRRGGLGGGSKNGILGQAQRMYLKIFISRTNVLILILLCLQKNRRTQRRFSKKRRKLLKSGQDIIKHNVKNQREL